MICARHRYVTFILRCVKCLPCEAKESSPPPPPKGCVPYATNAVPPCRSCKPPPENCETAAKHCLHWWPPSSLLIIIVVDSNITQLQSKSPSNSCGWDIPRLTFPAARGWLLADNDGSMCDVPINSTTTVVVVVDVPDGRFSCCSRFDIKIKLL